MRTVVGTFVENKLEYSMVKRTSATFEFMRINLIFKFGSNLAHADSYAILTYMLID